MAMLKSHPGKVALPVDAFPERLRPTICALLLNGYEVGRIEGLKRTDTDVYRVADGELIAWWDEGDWDSIYVMRLEHCPGAQLLRATREGSHD